MKKLKQKTISNIKIKFVKGFLLNILPFTFQLIHFQWYLISKQQIHFDIGKSM